MVSEATAPARRPGGDEATAGDARLPEILLTSLTALAAAGEVEQACRLAGQACAELRHTDPAAWHRFNVFLHRMIKHVS